MFSRIPTAVRVSCALLGVVCELIHALSVVEGPFDGPLHIFKISMSNKEIIAAINVLRSIHVYMYILYA